MALIAPLLTAQKICQGLNEWLSLNSSLVMTLQHITTLVQNIHIDCQCKIWLKALLIDLLMQQLLLKKNKQTVKLRNQMVPVLTVNRMDGPYEYSSEHSCKKECSYLSECRGYNRDMNLNKHQKLANPTVAHFFQTSSLQFNTVLPKHRR